MTIKTKIEALDHQGRGIAHLDGKIIFIPNALPDEEVQIKITGDKKNYALGEVTNYEKQSDKRVIPACPYYDKCGGCHLSHLADPEQVLFKKDTLINIFKKYVGLEINPEVIKPTQVSGYRNKITLKIIKGKWGYYSANSHQFIPIQKCLLAKPAINNIIANQKLFKINNGEIVIRVNYKNELLISINTKDKNEIDPDELIKDQEIIGIIINDQLFYGKDHFEEVIDQNIYQVSYDSFFQVNLNILKEVFKILNNDNYASVLDLYCGVGTLGIAMNKDKLYGIEISASSIQNALINNELNRQNNLYILGDSTKIKEINDQLDTVIIDPPRSGINKETLDHIIKKQPTKIIYMSCDPMTLARDLKFLHDEYQLNQIYLLDMFPQTYHLETICFLIKKKN